jgi:Ca-activated chloride channel homolog
MPEGLHDLFDIRWSFLDVTNGVKDSSFSLNFPVEFTSDIERLSAGLDMNVAKQVEITKSAQILEEAMNLFDSGDYESGQKILYTQAVTMFEKAKALNDGELLAESQVIFQQLEDFQYTRQKRKELHQEKYRQMKRRKK